MYLYKSIEVNECLPTYLPTYLPTLSKVLVRLFRIFKVERIPSIDRGRNQMDKRLLRVNIYLSRILFLIFTFVNYFREIVKFC